MTVVPALRYLTYGALWASMVLAYRRYRQLRPDRPIPQVYLILAGLLAVLQLYGEAWRR